VDANTTNIVTTVVTNVAGVAVTNKVARPQFLEAKDGGIPYTQGVSNGIRRVIRSKMLERDGWNNVEVIVRRDSATYLVNGEVNNRVSDLRQFVNGQWNPLTKGKIAFQLEFSEVMYRNIEIKPLDK
jgi:hypothetical protein